LGWWFHFPTLSSCSHFFRTAALIWTAIIAMTTMFTCLHFGCYCYQVPSFSSPVYCCVAYLDRIRAYRIAAAIAAATNTKPANMNTKRRRSRLQRLHRVTLVVMDRIMWRRIECFWNSEHDNNQHTMYHFPCIPKFM
jgi:hypothetical protein